MKTSKKPATPSIQQIDYLRISLTDRCGLNCFYCRPANLVKKQPREEIIRSHEILRLVNLLVQIGIKRIRLTGGEPLLRKDILTIASQLSEIPEIIDMAITTNGIHFPKIAKELWQSGVKRANFSLDSLNSKQFHQVTGSHLLTETLAGIKSAENAGFSPIKINTVLMKGINDKELQDMVAFTMERDLIWRFIELMPFGGSNHQNLFFSAMDAMNRIKEKFSLVEVPIKEKPTGNGPALYYQIPGAKGLIGFISPVSRHLCGECTRLRLTADGKLRLCLFSTEEVDLLTPLRDGESDEILLSMITSALEKKSQVSGCQDQPNSREMYQIGG